MKHKQNEYQSSHSKVPIKWKKKSSKRLPRKEAARVVERGDEQVTYHHS